MSPDTIEEPVTVTASWVPNGALSSNENQLFPAIRHPNNQTTNPVFDTNTNREDTDGRDENNGVVPDYGDYNDDDNGDDVRIGTISSARFNILSTMVGGGCLSLPLAFQQSGNALMGPVLLLVTALTTDFCFRLLVSSAVTLHPPHPRKSGNDTFESITSAAFGTKAYIFSMTLVVLMCFFGAVGYSVLLRDMMEPINDRIAPSSSTSSSSSKWFHDNFTMFLVILLVTPFCTLRHLTALKDCGAASMTSILILGSCIVYRSVQCNFFCKSDDNPSLSTMWATASVYYDDSSSSSSNKPWYTYLTFFPKSWHELLDAAPLYISCFVCHYNILPVHNELKDPTPTRVSWWLRSTLLFSCVMYMIIGFAGSAYAKCTPTGKVHGNILLDFDENDPLLMVGRMCLAVTITLAFPMLVIPARHIILRSLILPLISNKGGGEGQRRQQQDTTPTQDEQLQEPLLSDEDPQPETNTSNGDGGANTTEGTQGGHHNDEIQSTSVWILLCTSIVIFWSAGVLASLVSSIDIVWDLLGSSLSILLSYLIPAGTYLVITKKQQQDDGGPEQQQQRSYTRQQYWSRVLCWILLLFFFPLMIVSTANAVINTFFE